MLIEQTIDYQVIIKYFYYTCLMAANPGQQVSGLDLASESSLLRKMSYIFSVLYPLELFLLLLFNINNIWELHMGIYVGTR